MKQVTCWHFANETLRDGRPLPKKGETLTHDGDVIPCESGFHGSKRAIDALNYAPGTMVARVLLTGDVKPHGDPVDKYAARNRKNLTDYVDCKDVLVELARVWALRAAREHAALAFEVAGMEKEAKALRALPDDATPKQIETAARAARDAARAARDAARDAAWAARAAARAAAWAARDAARAAAWDARDAARATAWDAESDLQNKELEPALKELLKERR